MAVISSVLVDTATFSLHEPISLPAPEVHELQPTMILINIFHAVSTAFIIISTTIFFIRSFLRLRHIPGPFLASLTDLWAAYKYWSGTQYPDLLTQLHEEYGPVVRWGPNRVSFASADSIPTIYSRSKVFPKSNTYRTLTVVIAGKEVEPLMTIQDEKRVGSIKRNMIGGFSQSSFLKQEPSMDRILGNLLGILDKLIAKNNGIVDLSKELPLWSFNTIHNAAFGGDSVYLTNGRDTAQVFDGVHQRFEHAGQWWVLPKVEQLIFKNPIVAWLTGAEPPNVLTKIAMGRVRERNDQSGEALETDLLGRFLKASRDVPEAVSATDVVALTISTIHAGSDTTATMATCILSDLLKHPAALRRLQNEIFSANLTTPASFDSVASLSYLDAVIRETMRLRPISPFAMDRQVTGAGAIIAGHWIPGQTDVSSNSRLTQLDSSIFGSDSGSFRPERWTDADKETFRRMDRHHMGFGQGRRLCIGINLARIEMKKLLATLLVKYKISLAEEPSIGWHRNTRKVTLTVQLEKR